MCTSYAEGVAYVMHTHRDVLCVCNTHSTCASTVTLHTAYLLCRVYRDARNVHYTYVHSRLCCTLRMYMMYVAATRNASDTSTV